MVCIVLVSKSFSYSFCISNPGNYTFVSDLPFLLQVNKNLSFTSTSASSLQSKLKESDLLDTQPLRQFGFAQTGELLYYDCSFKCSHAIFFTNVVYFILEI